MSEMLSSKDEFMQSNHSRGNRLWQTDTVHLDPPIPEWIEELWTRHGKPRPKRRYGTEGQAWLWFVSEWVPLRAPYRFPLRQDLVAWLNATELDFTRETRERPGVCGPVPCDSFKPVSRFMYTVAEQHRWQPLGSENYYDFLGWYAFLWMPASNIPGILLPGPVIDLLNLPATDDDIPLTLGMLLYLRHAYPDPPAFGVMDRERLLAFSFCAVEGMLSIGQLRLVPEAVSRFWRQRPLKLVTAFEYVAANANAAKTNGTPGGVAPTEEDVRDWFQREVAGGVRGAPLMSGRPVKGTAVEARESTTESAIVVYRDHDSVCGISKASVAARDALLQTGMPVFDLHFSLKRERLSSEMQTNQALWINARRRLHLLNMNPEFVSECSLCNASRIWPKDYIVGQFYWELSRISKIHHSGIKLVDEIWTASRYLTDIYVREIDRPVFTMGQAIVAREPAAPLDRGGFGFNDGDYLFLSNFDVRSIVERKNPLGAVIAFQEAFPRGTEPVGLIIKTRNLENLPTERDRTHWASAAERIRKDTRIRVIDQTMSEDAMAALYRMCDCFVSLHRSEGFGFGPAEAMAYGRPAIVTNYSGVCDFCTEATAKLVPYELIRVNDNEYPYLDPDRAYEWADPDLTIAAECMRELAEDQEESKRLGRVAQEFIAREYSISALRRRYISRLEELGFVQNAHAAEVYVVTC